MSTISSIAPGRRPLRRLSRAGAWLALVAGVLVVADVVVTQVWQEPVSAFLASRRQHQLAGDLRRLDRAPVPRADLVQLARLPDERQRVRSLAARLNRRVAAGDPLGRISIPHIGVDFVLVQGTGDASLTKGPGHYPGTPLPGGRGTVGIAGHRTTYLAPFRNIDRLRRGDRIVIAMPYGRFEYRVTGQRVVAPSDDSVLRPAARSQVVLTACTPPFSAAQRLVVTARLVRFSARGAARPPARAIAGERPQHGLRGRRRG